VGASADWLLHSFFSGKLPANARVLILENHPIFGGEAKQNEFEVDGRRLTAHQGSAIYFVQYPRSFLAEFYDSIGLRQPRLQYQTWGGRGAPWPSAARPMTPKACRPANTASGSGNHSAIQAENGLSTLSGKSLPRAPVTEAEPRRTFTLVFRRCTPAFAIRPASI
jgi:spermidine dehydrogenase